MSGNGEIPEFKDEYVPAFCALMLFKLGGAEKITVELLEKFPKKETPIISWSPDDKSFVMSNPKAKRKRGIVKPKKKIVMPGLRHRGIFRGV